jgi:hypothetical protein
MKTRSCDPKATGAQLPPTPKGVGSRDMNEVALSNAGALCRERLILAVDALRDAHGQEVFESPASRYEREGNPHEAYDVPGLPTTPSINAAVLRMAYEPCVVFAKHLHGFTSIAENTAS